MESVGVDCLRIIRDYLENSEGIILFLHLQNIDFFVHNSLSTASFWNIFATSDYKRSVSLMPTPDSKF